MRKILNAGNLLGALAFLALLAIPGAVEAGMYLTAAALGAILVGCAWMASRESGK
ncbi:MAG: hypothetical protein HFH83_04445 [Lachnospiraceae bacterium]|jgi:hypothetical protein|nr:hypothetical protein [Lachnospiraceae bacterium]